MPKKPSHTPRRGGDPGHRALRSSLQPVRAVSSTCPTSPVETAGGDHRFSTTPSLYMGRLPFSLSGLPSKPRSYSQTRTNETERPKPKTQLPDMLCRHWLTDLTGLLLGLWPPIFWCPHPSSQATTRAPAPTAGFEPPDSEPLRASMAPGSHLLGTHSWRKGPSKPRKGRCRINS